MRVVGSEESEKAVLSRISEPEVSLYRFAPQQSVAKVL